MTHENQNIIIIIITEGAEAQKNNGMRIRRTK